MVVYKARGTWVNSVLHVKDNYKPVLYVLISDLLTYIKKLLNKRKSSS